MLSGALVAMAGAPKAYIGDLCAPAERNRVRRAEVGAEDMLRTHGWITWRPARQQPPTNSTTRRRRRHESMDAVALRRLDRRRRDPGFGGAHRKGKPRSRDELRAHARSSVRSQR